MDERTILVVEDDADINALLAKIAAREGFGCVQAYSGTEALLQMERAAFDLVLLDMMLPGMDGPTLMACMRDELASRVPVIVVSAKAGSADKVFSRELLYELVWKNGYYGEQNAVNVHVSNIRKKLAAAGGAGDYIKTVWGIGFKLA